MFATYWPHLKTLHQWHLTINDFLVSNRCLCQHLAKKRTISVNKFASRSILVTIGTQNIIFQGVKHKISRKTDTSYRLTVSIIPSPLKHVYTSTEKKQCWQINCSWIYVIGETGANLTDKVDFRPLMGHRGMFRLVVPCSK